MIGLGVLIASFVCSSIWVFMTFSGMRRGAVFSIRYETWMFGSIAFGVLATVFVRIGI